MDRKVFRESDETVSYMHEYKASILQPLLHGKRKKRLLDVGCWTGQLLRALEKRSVDMDYHGIDISKEAINQASKQYSNTNFKTGSALNIPYKESKFDVVTFLDVIEHLPMNTESSSLKEIYRVLKKKGILFLVTPNSDFRSIAMDPAYFLMGHRHYSNAEINSLLSCNGFKVISHTAVGGYFNKIEHLVHLFFKHVFKKDTPRGLKKTLISKAKEELRDEGFLSHYVIAEKV